MSKAKELLSVVEALKSGPLKVGDQVKFIAKHDLAGLVGLVQDIHRDGKVAVKVGNSIRVSVPVTDLEKIKPGVSA